MVPLHSILLFVFQCSQEKYGIWLFITLAVLSPDCVYCVYMYGREAEPFEIPGKLFRVKTMVHDSFGVVLMKGAVFFIKISQSDDTARFQAMKEFRQNAVYICKVMQGHGRENQVEVLLAVIMMQIKVLWKNVLDPLCTDLGFEYLQHTRGRICGDKGGQAIGQTQSHKSGATTVFHGSLISVGVG